jgi:diacylglycerol kinase (ATP)
VTAQNNHNATATAPIATSYTLFVNPRAGRGAAPRLAEAVARALRAAGRRCEIAQHSSPEEALAYAQTLPQGTAIIPVGGDGTVSALLPAAVCTGRPFGLIPAGRGNDFAYALGWRRWTPEGIAERLQRETRALDVLRVTLGGRTRYSLNGFGMGFDAQVAAYAAEMPRSLGGFGSYAAGVVLAFRDLHQQALTATVDGAEVFSGLSFLGAVMNGRRYGGGFHISPEGKLSDGKLELIVGRAVGRAGLVPLIARLLFGQHLKHPRVVYARGQRASLRWAVPVKLHLDGDLHPATGDVQVEVVPESVQVLGA